MYNKLLAAMGKSASHLLPLGLAGALIALSGGCDAFQARSSEFTCEQESQCDSPRTCVSGYCVVPNELIFDAALGDPDSSAVDAMPADAMPDAAWTDADLATCASIDLVDNFEDFVSWPNWAIASDNGIDVDEDGALLIYVDSLPNTPSSGGYTSFKKDYILTNSSFLIEVPDMPNIGSKASSIMVLEGDANNNLVFEQKSGVLRITERVDSDSRVLVSEDYSPTAHRWWRVIDYQGIYRVQTSANGVAWVEKAFAATPDFFAAVQVQLTMRTLSTGEIPGLLSFDNAGGGMVVQACPQ